MRRTFFTIALGVLVCFVFSTSLSGQQTTGTSSQASLDLQRSYSQLVGNTSIADVALTGSVRRIAGSDDESGSATFKALSKYNYGDTVTATSGTPQHTAPAGSRGNVLSINSYTQGSTYLTTSMTYFDTGNVQTVTDINGAQTTYTYGACGNTFPTSVTEPLSLAGSMTWNCTGG